MSTNTHVIHVLGIESSCDDTGVAIIRSDRTVLSNCVNSQLKQHIAHGGIIPMVAKEYHLSNIDCVANQAFKESSLESMSNDIDAIAVTNRPGMDYSLQVGLNYARRLAKKYSKPLLPIHHMQAHALMPLLENRSIRYPFLALLLSGGHCILSICKKFNQFDMLGSSLDDAPGDILDKIARRCRVKNLGPPYDRMSGGAALELLSKRPNVDELKYYGKDFFVPMTGSQSCDFSFSGYYGTFGNIVPTIDELWKRGHHEALLDELGHVAGSIQRSILIQIAKKLQRALAFYRMHWRYKNQDAFDKSYEPIHGANISVRPWSESDSLDLVISGGVAANSYLIRGIKKVIKQEIDDNINVYTSSESLCSDNGLMIAWNGLLRYLDHLSHDGEYDADKPLDENVISDEREMDCVGTSPECLIGADIRQQVRLANFELRRLRPQWLTNLAE